MTNETRINLKNIKKLLEISAQTGLDSIIKIIEDNNGAIRFVGGCVRNALLGITIDDIDLATSLKPTDLIHILNQHGIKTIPTGIKHGTVTVILGNNHFEITTLRKDLICNGRHATVQYTDNWQDDAFRRDFTFNALYADSNGNLYDYCSGIEDLECGKLQFMGDPATRIKEDYLRILRAFRFHAYICIQPIDELILNECSEHSAGIAKLSGERIREEMLKILSYSRGLSEIFTMESINITTHIFDSKVNRALNLRSSNGNSTTKLAILIKHCHNPLKTLDFIIKRWRFSNNTSKTIKYLLSINIDANQQEENITKLGKDRYLNVIKMLYLEDKISNTQYNEMIDFCSSWEEPKFPVSGKDIIALGIPQGESIKHLLEAAKKEWHRSKYSSDKQALLKYIKSQT